MPSTAIGCSIDKFYWTSRNTFEIVRLAYIIKKEAEMMERKCKFCRWWSRKSEGYGVCKNKKIGVRKLEFSSSDKLYTISSNTWYGSNTEPDFGCIHFCLNRKTCAEWAKIVRDGMQREDITSAELIEMLEYWMLRPSSLANLIGVSRQCVNDWLRRKERTIPRSAIVTMKAMGLFPIPEEPTAEKQ